MDLARNRVPIQVWEGTQWLLRDPNGNVRKTYVDALCTWLDREIVYTDLIATDDALVPHRVSKNGRDVPTARRAVSNASTRDRYNRVHRCQFLPLLHLAAYDCALQSVEYDNDIVLLHSLLTKLVFKLGVNAARCGVPMIYRLQEDIQELEHPIHKVRIATLCHGYFWALSEKFDFESSAVGRAVYNEIVRRKSKGFWVEGVHVPAPKPSQIGTPGQARPHPNWDIEALATEEILPFDDRSSMIECIATSYENTDLSPPTSPAASPNRNLNGPILNSNGGGNGVLPDKFSELPHQFKDQMLSDWTRASAVAAITAAGKSESLNGSRTGTTGTAPNRLTINTAAVNGNGHLAASLRRSNQNLRPHTSHTHADRLTPVAKVRKSSVTSALSPADSVASKTGIASVQQLKMILSGNVSPQAAGIPGTQDDSDESMISCECSMSEKSFNPGVLQTDAPTTTGEILARSISASASFKAGVSPSNPTAHDGGPPVHQNRAERDDDVPPVPPLPNLSSLSSKIGTQSIDSPYGLRNTNSGRGSESLRSSSMRFREESSKSLDLQELLRGIDSRSGEGSLGNLTKPPY
jgi:hypothetical protein